MLTPILKPYARHAGTFEEVKALPEWQYFSDDIKYWMKRAYDEDFDALSDGISWISQLGFVGPHPAGVLHDYLYSTKPMSRKEADQVFRDALTQMGYGDYAKVYYRALRAFGWWAWWRSGK